MMLPTVCKKLFTSIDLGYFSCDNEFEYNFFSLLKLFTCSTPEKNSCVIRYGMHLQKYEYGTGNVNDIIMTILCAQIFIFLNLFRPFFPQLYCLVCIGL